MANHHLALGFGLQSSVITKLIEPPTVPISIRRSASNSVAIDTNRNRNTVKSKASRAHPSQAAIKAVLIVFGWFEPAWRFGPRH